MEIIKCTNDDLDRLYDGSAWTWEGMSTDEKSLKDIIEWFREVGCPLKEEKFYVASGEQLNNYKFGLTGVNAYQNDLNILLIELDNIVNVEKLYLVKFRVGARWFDDICENNRERERRKDGRILKNFK